MLHTLELLPAIACSAAQVLSHNVPYAVFASEVIARVRNEIPTKRCHGSTLKYNPVYILGGWLVVMSICPVISRASASACPTNCNFFGIATKLVNIFVDPFNRKVYVKHAWISSLVV